MKRHRADFESEADEQQQRPGDEIQRPIGRLLDERIVSAATPTKICAKKSAKLSKSNVSPKALSWLPQRSTVSPAPSASPSKLIHANKPFPGSLMKRSSNMTTKAVSSTWVAGRSGMRLTSIFLVLFRSRFFICHWRGLGCKTSLER